MISLDEAIKFFENLAKLQRRFADEIKEMDSAECSRNNKQLAEWLKELKAYKEAEAEKEAQEEARREAMKLDEADGTLKGRGYA